MIAPAPNIGSAILWMYQYVQINHETYAVPVLDEVQVQQSFMPYTRLRDYPCENQTQNTGEDAILAVILPQYNE